MILGATIPAIILARASALQAMPFRRSTGNDISEPLFLPFFFLIFSSVATFSHAKGNETCTLSKAAILQVSEDSYHTEFIS